MRTQVTKELKDRLHRVGIARLKTLPEINREALIEYVTRAEAQLRAEGVHLESLQPSPGTAAAQ